MYIFRARISECKFRQVLRLFAADVSAQAAADLSALNSRHRPPALPPLAGAHRRPGARSVASFRGGDPRSLESDCGPRRVRGKRGRGAGGKTPVLGLHKRGTQVFVSVVKDGSRQEWLPIIAGHGLGRSDVSTDGWLAYEGLVLPGFRHRRECAV